MSAESDKYIKVPLLLTFAIQFFSVNALIQRFVNKKS